MSTDPGTATPAPGLAASLIRVYAAVDMLAGLDGQDTTLTVEMSQAMLSDLITDGQLRAMRFYVGRYCDVADTPEDADRIADDI